MAIGTPVLRATEFQQNLTQATTALATSSAIAANSLIFIWLQTRTTTQATMTVTDSAGLGLTYDYHSATFVTQAISMNLAVANCPAGVSSGTTFTCTTSGNTGKQTMNIAEVTGLDTTAVAAHANGAGTSGAPNSGSITTTTADTLVFGAFAMGGAGTLTFTSNSTGFTTLQPVSTNQPASSPIHGFAEYRIRSATGTDTEAPTVSINTNSAAIIVDYPIAPAAPTIPIKTAYFFPSKARKQPQPRNRSRIAWR